MPTKELDEQNVECSEQEFVILCGVDPRTTSSLVSCYIPPMGLKLASLLCRRVGVDSHGSSTGRFDRV